MVKMKKILSVALAVLMLFSVLAISTSAIADGKKFGVVLTTETNLDTIKAGDTVTVTMRWDMPDYSQLLSDARFAILFDANVYTFDAGSRVFLGDLAGYAMDTGTCRQNDGFATQVKNASTMTAEEKAMYPNGLMLQIVADVNGKGQNNRRGYAVTQDPETGLSVPQMKLTFTVKDPTAGTKNIAICDNGDGAKQHFDYTDGDTATPPIQYVTAEMDASRGNLLANVPVANTFIDYYRNQIKYTGLAANGTDYNFDYRFLVKFDGTELVNKIGSSDVNVMMQKIVDIGFVFSYGDFVMADAKNAAMNGSTGIYKDKEITKLSTNASAGDYVMACTIEGIKGEEHLDSVNALPYIAVDANGDSIAQAEEYFFIDDADWANGYINESFDGLYQQYLDKATA